MSNGGMVVARSAPGFVDVVVGSVYHDNDGARLTDTNGRAWRIPGGGHVARHYLRNGETVRLVLDAYGKVADVSPAW